jgi:hypothetical protein
VQKEFILKVSVFKAKPYENKRSSKLNRALSLVLCDDLVRVGLGMEGLWSW